MEDQTSTRGTKRKRYQAPEKDLQTKVNGKLHHILKEVKKAAKKAKAFDTQKSVKKLKAKRSTASPEDPELRDLESQLEILKHSDHDQIALTALRSKILKDKLLSPNEFIQAAVSKELGTLSSTSEKSSPATEPSSAIKRVENRLLSSKILSMAVNAAVIELRLTIMPKTVQGEQEEITEEIVVSKARAESQPEVSTKGKTKATNLENNRTQKYTLDISEDEEIVDGEEVDDGAGWESGTIADESSAEDPEDFDGFDLASLASDPASDDDTSSSSSSIRAVATKKSKTVPETKPKAKAASSTFLPSLSVGYVGGGSGDDSDVSNEAAEAEPPRKNRRGQRARQAIWEKKYGKNANHVKQQQTVPTKWVNGNNRQDNTKRDGGRPGSALDTKRQHPTVRAPKQQLQQPDSGWQQRAQGSSSKPKPQGSTTNKGQSSKDAGGLHPSWEAKKREKEKQGAGGGIVPFKGKKIVF